MTLGPIIAVFRGLDTEAAVHLAHAVVAGGVTAVEITMDSPNAAKSIAALVEEMPVDVAVGAGTVVTLQELADARAAGATFGIAPHLDVEILGAAISHGLLFVPGVASPTELHNATSAGASMVKLFPGASLGLDYLRALRGPYPEIPIMVSGGVKVDAIGDWIAAGANSVGLGASSFGSEPRVTAAHAVALAHPHH